MNHIEDIVDSLEAKINRVLGQLEALRQVNLSLTKQLSDKEQTLQSQKQEITAWKDRYETLKIANSMLGSDENKRETKLKINTLIRDIDHCITQLSE